MTNWRARYGLDNWGPDEDEGPEDWSKMPTVPTALLEMLEARFGGLRVAATSDPLADKYHAGEQNVVEFLRALHEDQQTPA